MRALGLLTAAFGVVAVASGSLAPFWSELRWAARALLGAALIVPGLVLVMIGWQMVRRPQP